MTAIEGKRSQLVGLGCNIPWAVLFLIGWTSPRTLGAGALENLCVVFWMEALLTIFGFIYLATAQQENVGRWGSLVLCLLLVFPIIGVMAFLAYREMGIRWPIFAALLLVVRHFVESFSRDRPRIPVPTGVSVGFLSLVLLVDGFLDKYDLEAPIPAFGWPTMDWGSGSAPWGEHKLFAVATVYFLLLVIVGFFRLARTQGKTTSELPGGAPQ